MKGIVFTEFFEMVEQEWGFDILDQIIENSELENNGVYTAVGTYNHKELASLVVALSKPSNKTPSKLLISFGEYLFSRFAILYPAFFETCSSSIQFLCTVEDVIHVEVKKLYPEAELPKFTIEEVNDQYLIMRYQSQRKLEDFAHGLILGCIAHFGDDLKVIKNVSDDQYITEFQVLKND